MYAAQKQLKRTALINKLMLQLNLPELRFNGRKVTRTSSCCCCCDVASAACPSRDEAPRKAFFSPEMSDRYKNRYIGLDQLSE